MRLTHMPFYSYFRLLFSFVQRYFYAVSFPANAKLVNWPFDRSGENEWFKIMNVVKTCGNLLRLFSMRPDWARSLLYRTEMSIEWGHSNRWWRFYYFIGMLTFETLTKASLIQTHCPFWVKNTLSFRKQRTNCVHLIYVLTVIAI